MKLAWLLILSQSLVAVQTFQVSYRRSPLRKSELSLHQASKREPEKSTPNKLSEALKLRRNRFTEDVSRRFNFTVAAPQLPLGFLGGLAAGCALTVAVAVGPLVDSEKVDDGGLRESVVLFESVIRQLKDEYVDEVDPRRLFTTATNAMLRSLDPYTEFEATKRNSDELRESVTGRYGGVGLVIAGDPAAAKQEAAGSKKSNDLEPDPGPSSSSSPSSPPSTAPSAPGGSSKTKQQEGKAKKAAAAAAAAREPGEGRGAMVVNAFEGYAYNRGLRVGDFIVAVDGKSVRGLDADRVRDLLRGPPGTFVTLTIERDTKRPVASPNPEDLSNLRQIVPLAPAMATASDATTVSSSSSSGGGGGSLSIALPASSTPSVQVQSGDQQRVANPPAATAPPSVFSASVAKPRPSPSAESATAGSGNERRTSAAGAGSGGGSGAAGNTRVFEVDLPRSSVKLRDVKLALLLNPADATPVDVAGVLQKRIERQDREERELFEQQHRGVNLQQAAASLNERRVAAAAAATAADLAAAESPPTALSGTATTGGAAATTAAAARFNSPSTSAGAKGVTGVTALASAGGSGAEGESTVGALSARTKAEAGLAEGAADKQAVAAAAATTTAAAAGVGGVEREVLLAEGQTRSSSSSSSGGSSGGHGVRGGVASQGVGGGAAAAGAAAGKMPASPQKPIGFIQLTGFTQDTGRELLSAYVFLEKQAQLVAEEELYQEQQQQQQLLQTQQLGGGKAGLGTAAATSSSTTAAPGGGSGSKGDDSNEDDGSGVGSRSTLLEEEYLGGLVVDLRSNPGGLLNSAVQVASLLVPKDSNLVSAQGRGFESVQYRSAGTPLRDPAKTPLAVLVNRGTASAAEIVSGAVQDLDAGVIVGEDRTFGKGLVQNIEALPFDTALKFTVAKYYTPSGRCIQSTEYKDNGSARKTAADPTAAAAGTTTTSPASPLPPSPGGSGPVLPGDAPPALPQVPPPPPAAGGDPTSPSSSSSVAPQQEGNAGGQETTKASAQDRGSNVVQGNDDEGADDEDEEVEFGEDEEVEGEGDDDDDEDEAQSSRREGGGSGGGRMNGRGGGFLRRRGKEEEGRKFSARAVSEAERKQFQTANGRAVRDSGGIEVDVAVPAPKLSLVEALLIREGALFDYATKWTKANEFRGRPVVTDAVFSDFTSFVMEGVRTNAFKPEDVYAPQLASLEQTLKASKQQGALEVAEQLRATLGQEVKADLKRLEPEVRAALEEAILSRYLPESQLRLIGLERDDQVKAAVAVVGDRARYDALLSPPQQQASAGAAAPTATDVAATTTTPPAAPRGTPSSGAL